MDPSFSRKLFLGQHNIFRKKRVPGSCSTSWKLIKVFFSVAAAPGTHNMLPQLGSCRDKTTVWWANRGCLTIYLPFSICLPSPAVLEPFRQGQKNWMHIKYLFSATSVNKCVGVLQKTEKEDRCTNYQTNPHQRERAEIILVSRGSYRVKTLCPSLAPTKLYQEPKGTDNYNSLLQVFVKLCRTVFQSLWNWQTDKH